MTSVPRGIARLLAPFLMQARQTHDEAEIFSYAQFCCSKPFPIPGFRFQHPHTLLEHLPLRALLPISVCIHFSKSRFCPLHTNSLENLSTQHKYSSMVHGHQLQGETQELERKARLLSRPRLEVERLGVARLVAIAGVGGCVALKRETSARTKCGAMSLLLSSQRN